MPIIYGNPGTGRFHRAEQPVIDGSHEAPKKKRTRPKRPKDEERARNVRKPRVVQHFTHAMDWYEGPLPLRG